MFVKGMVWVCVSSSCNPYSSFLTSSYFMTVCATFKLDIFFFFNQHCSPCGFWPAQLLLSILSRKVFTECRCQQHVKPLTWRIRMFKLSPPGVPHIWNIASEPQQWKVEPWARNGWEFCRKWRLPRHFWVLLHAVNLRHGADGFTSPLKEGVLRIFFTRKIWRLRPGLNPRTRVPEASTLTSRPPKPLKLDITTQKLCVLEVMGLNRKSTTVVKTFGPLCAHIITLICS